MYVDEVMRTFFSPRQLTVITGTRLLHIGCDGVQFSRGPRRLRSGGADRG